MRFLHLSEQIYLRPWFITPEAHASIRMIFERAAMHPRAGVIDELIADIPKRKPMAIDSAGIASIHIFGPLGKGLSKMEQSCGATGFEQIRADYTDALKAGARGILLEVDSPGGTVVGTPEIADLVASKPVKTVAYTEDMMASAAYYIGAGADAIVSSSSALVGSIGVYIPWMDRSAQYAAAGIKPDPIVNTGGDLKAMGFGGTLTAAQRTHLQEAVDSDFSEFKRHVTTYRALPDSAMRGQVLNGREAIGAKLVDALGSMETAKAKLIQLMSAAG
jgi:signal peptide peptidase SppA